MTLRPDDLNGDREFEALYRQNLELRRQVEHLATLREIGLAISASLEKDETMRLIATVVQGALEVRRLTIYEADKENDTLRPTIAKYGGDLITPERLEEDVVPRRKSPLWEVMDHPKVLLRESGHYFEAYVPLVAKHEPLGVMLLQDHHDDSPFTAHDAVLFRQLGSQIAVAINNAQLYAQAVTDGLTKLYVRRYFDLRLREEFILAKRDGIPFSILMFDIDHFKKFNDTHGHQTGDQVLRQFAVLLKKNTRASDICCRYGGEEMVIILPRTSLPEAGALAEKLCRAVRNQVFLGTEDQKLKVTTSVGVAAFASTLASPEALVEVADKALYQAKETGRDRVVLGG